MEDGQAETRGAWVKSIVPGGQMQRKEDPDLRESN